MTSPIPTAHQANSSHHPSPTGATPASPPNKRDLKSWWKGFKLPSKQQEPAGTRHAISSIFAQQAFPGLSGTFISHPSIMPLVAV
jgi:hypothetical protein